MHKMKCIKNKLIDAVTSQMENGIENIDTAEMGEVIDMIKDMSESIYYATLTDAMEDSEYGVDYDYKGAYRYYTPNTHHPRMYYTENDGGTMGKTAMMRHKYMESTDPTMKMQNLEGYAHSLMDDISEMIQDASDNERTMLRNKMQMIMQRI